MHTPGRTRGAILDAEVEVNSDGHGQSIHLCLTLLWHDMAPTAVLSLAHSELVVGSLSLGFPETSGSPGVLPVPPGASVPGVWQAAVPSPDPIDSSCAAFLHSLMLLNSHVLHVVLPVVLPGQAPAAMFVASCSLACSAFS